ncbi:MAG TPA: lytic transglycosylase domain-containing protein [Gaiellaceae bacterium]|jgi:soluble lytic murein transglycosylase-like protein|nr:lytic transglycosylase domain-containing protein [Gaiellaceae bacterium]
MWLRLFGLLLVAATGAWLAAAVAAAGTEEKAAVNRVPKATPAAARLCPLPERSRRSFERAARDTELPLALLTAVAQVESSLRRPPSNVLAAARYLRMMLDRFHSTDLALAAYNAGPTAVARAGGAPSAEVLTYVAKVAALWRRLQGCR